MIQAIEDITHDNEFKKLQKLQLNKEDWDVLKVYQQILQVIIYYTIYTDINPLCSPCILGCFGCWSNTYIVILHSCLCCIQYHVGESQGWWFWLGTHYPTRLGQVRGLSSLSGGYTSICCGYGWDIYILLFSGFST